MSTALIYSMINVQLLKFTITIMNISVYKFHNDCGNYEQMKTVSDNKYVSDAVHANEQICNFLH